MEKKGKAVKRKRKVEFGWQERVHGLRGSQICALLPGYTTTSSSLMLGCFVQEARARAERWPGQTQLQDVKPSPGVPGSTVLMGTRPPCPASERELKGSRTKSSPHHPIRPLASPGTSHLPLIPIPAQLPDPSRRSRRSPDCHRQEQREEKGKGHGACRVGGRKVNPERYAALWSVTFKKTAGLGQRSGGPRP